MLGTAGLQRLPERYERCDRQPGTPDPPPLPSKSTPWTLTPALWEVATDPREWGLYTSVAIPEEISTEAPKIRFSGEIERYER